MQTYLVWVAPAGPKAPEPRGQEQVRAGGHGNASLIAVVGKYHKGADAPFVSHPCHILSGSMFLATLRTCRRVSLSLPLPPPHFSAAQFSLPVFAEDIATA